MPLTWWLRRTKQWLENSSPRPAKPRRPQCRPAVEVMEDRIVPANRLFAIPPGNIIHELNPLTGAVVNTITAPESTTNGQNGLAFDGSRLFFINGGGSDRLYELNPDTGAVIDNDLITAGSGNYDGLAVVGGLVYIQDNAADQILAFDPATDTVVRTLTVAADLSGGLAGGSNPGALIGPINGGNLIAEIDPTTGTITNTFQPGFSGFLGAAVVGNEIYLGSGGTSTIFRYSRTGTFLGQIQTAFPMAALGSDDSGGPTSPPAPGSQFVNGDFEAGNVSGWTVFNQQPVGTASPGFRAYTGPNPLNSQLPAPPQGNFAAFDNHANAGTYILYQDVTLTAGQFHTLSLQAFYNNFASQFVTQNTLVATVSAVNQQFRIDVISPTGDLLSTGPETVLLNLFRTDPGEPNFQAPTTLTADLTPFAGQVVRLRVAVVSTAAPLFGAVDDVRLTSSGTAPTGTVTGVKFDDADGDGARDPGEAGLGGWTIYADLNNNRQLDANEPSTVTAADGTYTLTVPPGTYTFREVAQAGWVQTAPAYERLYTVRSGPVGGPQLITEVGPTGAPLNTFVGPGPVQATGPQGLASSGDSLFYIDGTQPQSTVGPHTLFELDPVTGAVLDSDVLPATGEINGLAYLNGLVYAQIHLTDQIMVFDPTTDTVVRTFNVAANIFGGLTGAADLGLLFATTQTGQVVAINPLTGGVVRTLPPNFGSFNGGLAYYRGELIASGGSPTATRLNPQTGAVLGSINLGGPGGSVTGLGGDGRVGGGRSATIGLNQSVAIDFGNRRDEGTVSGVKFNDIDGDGTRDAGEAGLAGWTVYADLNNNRQLDAGEPSTVTGTDGSYTLTVPSGVRSIREVAQPGWVQTSPFGYTLYSTGFNGQLLLTVNTVTGAAAPVGPFGSSQNASLAAAPDGTLWTIVNAFNGDAARLARVDPATGLATPIGGPLGVTGAVRALEADAAGNLYAGTSTGQLYRLNTTTGAATLIGPLGFSEVIDFAFDPAGALWAIRFGNQLFRVDPATGTSAFVANVFGLDGTPAGLMIHPGTGTFYVTTANSLFTVDPATGTTTRIGATQGPVTFGGDFVVDNGHTVSVLPGTAASGRDFANRRDEGVVRGVKYEDLDGDGTRDPGESALSGWTVYADLNNNAALDASEPTAVTDANGAYELTLPSGSYTLREVPQAGWVQTGPTSDRLFALRPSGPPTPSGPATLSIVELDPLGVVVNTLPAPAPVASIGAQGLAVGRDSLFYIDGSSLNNGTRTLYELNPITGAVIDSDVLPIVGTPVNGLGYLDGLVHISTGTNQIVVFNPATDTVVRTLTPGQPLVGGLAGASDQGLLFAASFGQVIALNPVTGAVVRFVPGPTTFNGGLAYRTGELLGIPFSGGSAPIFRIDALTGAPRGQLAPPGVTISGLAGDGPLPGPHRITVTPGAVLAGRDFGNQRTTAAVAADDVGAVGEDADLIVPPRGVLANDTGTLGVKAVVAVNGSATAVGRIVVLPSGARLRLDSNGGYTYTPGGAFNYLAAGQTATDSFTYTMSDGTAATATATVRVTITGANDGPTATPDTFATSEDDPAGGNVLANDIDPDTADTHTVVAVDGVAANVGETITLASGARLTLRADGTFDYDPSGSFDRLIAGETATDGFSYTIADAAGATSQASVVINLTGTNDGPTATADVADTDEDTPLTVANGVLANDTDPDTGDTRSVVAVNGSAADVGQAVTLASGARILLRADGSYDYDPRGALDALRAGETATDVVTYTIADAAGATSTATLTVTVRGVNDALVAGDDVGSTDEDTALTVGAPGLLGNDADPDAPTLTVAEVGTGGAVGQPVALASGAVVTVFADGRYVYDPNGAFEVLAPGQSAIDSFTYRVTDGTDSAVATVTITVTGVNDAPVTAADTYTTDEDTELLVTIANGVLANDTDADGALTAVIRTGPARGTVTLNADGSFTYRPTANFNGTDTFTYTASDGFGGTVPGTVTITVRSVNDAPVLAGATFTLAENSTVGTVVGTVTGTDADGGELRYRIVGGNTAGAFAINATTGRITVANRSALNFETTPTFALTVEVRDPTGRTATATVTVNLTDVIVPPAIDIDPDSRNNRIDLRDDRVSVAILSNAEFDARQIDVGTLRFGRTGSENSLSRRSNGEPRIRLVDVNRDGRLDLVVEFEVDRTGFQRGDTRGILTGRLLNGFTFTAEDAVSIR